MIKNFFNLGVTPNLPTEEAQIVRLTNIGVIIPMIAYLFYGAHSYYFDQPFTGILSVIIFVLSAISLYLNKQTKYSLSKTALFLVNGFGIWIGHHIYGENYSILALYIPLIFCIPLFYNVATEKGYLFVSIFFIFIELYSSLFMPKQVLYAISYDPEMMRLSDKGNYCLSILLTVLASYIILSNRDLTYKKLIHEREKAEVALNNLTRTQTRLVQAEKLASSGILLAGVSQEINEPIKQIKTTTDQLENELNNNSETTNNIYKSHIDRLKEESNKLGNTVRNLNYFNEQEPGIESTCDTNLLINNCLRILEKGINENIDVVKILLEKNQFVKGHLSQLHQVFFNILTNAFQAIGDVGIIVIRSERENDMLHIIISDTGIGVPKKDMQRIFDPFFTTKDSAKGSKGLGLSISYQIVSDHKGTIDFKSDPKKGTEVTITLPAT